LCRPCAQGQLDASKIGARLVYAVIALAPVAGLVTGVVTGRRDGIAVTAAVVVGLVVARFLLASIKRARARGTRVLLLEAEGDRVVLQLLVPERAELATVAGYRASACEDGGVDERVTPLSPRTSFGLPWYGGLLLCVPVVAAHGARLVRRFDGHEYAPHHRPVAVLPRVDDVGEEHAERARERDRALGKPARREDVQS